MSKADLKIPPVGILYRTPSRIIFLFGVVINTEGVKIDVSDDSFQMIRFRNTGSEVVIELVHVKCQSDVM